MPNTLPSHRACIAPLTLDATVRPLWSVMMPVYNCARYLREALSSVLIQDPGSDSMQIEVVDDHSTTDNPAAVLEEIAGERVGFYRQRENRGHVRNFETCLQRSYGRLVHLLHGDDYVREGFYRRMQQAFENRPEIGAAFCRHIYMDDDGHWQSLSPLERRRPGILEDWLEKIASGQRVAPPAMVVRRDVYERLGGFDRRLKRAGEDWEMWVRIAARYPVWFEPEPLAVYRVKRSGSLTGECTGTCELVGEMRQASDIIEEYLSEHLPAVKARTLVRRARHVYASWALEPVGEFLMSGDKVAVTKHLRQAYACSPSLETMQAMTWCLAQGGWRVGIRTMRSGLRRLRHDRR